CASKYFRELCLRDVSQKLDGSVALTLLPERLDVAARLGMIAAGDYQLGFRNLLLDQRECRKQALQTLVCSPASKSQYPGTVIGNWRLDFRSEYAVGMHVDPAGCNFVFLCQRARI